METLLTDTRPTARKDHRCMAWHWLEQAWPLGDYLSFAEMRAVVKAKRNGYMIKKGQQYVRRTGVQDGEMVTFKAIPALHDICLRHNFYDC